MVVRVVVPQDEIGLVRKHVRGVEVKLAEALSQNIAASVTRGVPAAQEQLPSRVLGSAGGGAIAVDPNDEQGLTPARSVFQLDVTLADEPSAWRIGQRAYVKFDHGTAPLAQQWLRLGRQLFLRRFGV
jgi:putative peptide zinc metalloprotease protein